MTFIRQTLFYVILKDILVSSIPLLVAGFYREGLFSISPLVTWFCLFLVLFLRATILSPTWTMKFKWTMLVCIPLEASLYGGSTFAHPLALLSFLRFIVGYGFVLNLNPVQTYKDTLSNRSVEILLSCMVAGIFSKSFMQGFIVQLCLSIHMYKLSYNTLNAVCESLANADTTRHAAQQLVPFKSQTTRIPIEVWIMVYFCATRGVSNFVPQELLMGIFNEANTTPWQLRRLAVRAISNDPTRSQMKTLLDIVKSDRIITAGRKNHNMSSSLVKLLIKGPQSLVSEESNERVVVNEAIMALARLYDSLGGRKFTAAFDRSIDAKLALDIISNGFK